MKITLRKVQYTKDMKFVMFLLFSYKIPLLIFKSFLSKKLNPRTSSMRTNVQSAEETSAVEISNFYKYFNQLKNYSELIFAVIG